MHTPVLLSKVTEYFNPAPGKKYLDCTLGYAGHTLALLEKGASVVGIDQDVDILELASKRITEFGLSSQFIGIHSSFASTLGSDRLEAGSFDGILFDLGVSSYQLDTASRGFSFRHDAPLDMRMNKDLAVTAKDLVNGLGIKELTELFATLGEERYAKPIATAIVAARKDKPLTTTGELAHLIEKIISRVSHSKQHIHPATRVFQALRMAVNSEREELKAALPSALSKLTTGGILAVITFHSLEENIVQEFFDAHKSEIELLTPDPVLPSHIEIQDNPRSRSAKLRVGRLK